MTTGTWLLQNEEQKIQEFIEKWTEHLYINREPTDLADLQRCMKSVNKTIEKIGVKISDLHKFNDFVKNELKNIKTHDINYPANISGTYKKDKAYDSLSIMQVKYKMKNLLDANGDALYLDDMFHLNKGLNPAIHLYHLFFYFYKEDKYKKRLDEFVNMILKPKWQYLKHRPAFLLYLYENGYVFDKDQMVALETIIPKRVKDGIIAIINENRYFDEQHLGDMIGDYIYQSPEASDSEASDSEDVFDVEWDSDDEFA